MRPLLISTVAVLLIGAGCAGVPQPRPQEYLPVLAASPVKMIDLSSAVTKDILKKPAPSTLHWLAEDALVFVIQDREDWENAFLIDPVRDNILLLPKKDRKALQKLVEKNDLSGDWGPVGEFAKFLVQATVAIAAHGGGNSISVGPLKGRRFDGTIANNGHTLQLDAKIEKRRRYWFRRKYTLFYDVKDERTGRSIDGIYPLGTSTAMYEEALRGWLLSWRISPDGRYYLIGKTATVIDASTDREYSFGHDRSYAALDIDPAWDKVAVLQMEQDKASGGMKCWIEIYPFAYPAALAGTDAGGGFSTPGRSAGQ